MLRALQRAGFVVMRIQGSHHFLSHPQDPSRWATVPVHGKETLSPKVVSAILKSARLSPEELKELL
ncbi:MAG: type II toxin-antitoxin system HicA family toxin [Moorellaceae bacterium]